MIDKLKAYCEKHAELFRSNMPSKEKNPYKEGFDNGYNLGASQALEEIIREFLTTKE